MQIIIKPILKEVAYTSTQHPAVVKKKILYQVLR